MATHQTAGPTAEAPTPRALAVLGGDDLDSLLHRAIRAAIGVLVEMGRLRHGDVAVLRALARRERDTPRALQVM